MKEFREMMSALKSLQLPNHDLTNISGHRRGQAAKRGRPSRAQGIRAAWAGRALKARSAPTDLRIQNHRQAAQTQSAGKKIPSQHSLLN